jgi:hypothetical protein
MENPKLMYTEEKVNIYVPRACGDFTFELMKPHPVGKPKSTDREQDLLGIEDWLTGGKEGTRNQETDCYGVVTMDFSTTMSEYLFDILYSTGSKDAFNPSKMGKERKVELAEVLESAKKRSRERVYRAIRRTYECFAGQIQRNKEAGINSHEPSIVEELCKYALRAEIELQNKQRKARVDFMSEPILKSEKLDSESQSINI